MLEDKLQISTDQKKKRAQEINLDTARKFSKSNNSIQNTDQENILNEKLSKIILNFFPEGIAFIDKNMNVLYANNQVLKLF